MGPIARFATAVGLSASLACSSSEALEFLELYPGLLGIEDVEDVYRYNLQDEATAPSGVKLSPYILLQGQIEEGDRSEFLSYMLERAKLESPVSVVVLNSPGGDLFEAIRIGETIRELALSTQIGHPGMSEVECSSACFFIFAAGVRRSMHFGQGSWPTVALHRPRFINDDFAQLEAKSAEERYKIVEQISIGYLRAMGIDEFLIARMFKASSTTADVLRPEEMWEQTWIVPYLDELLVSRCGGLSYPEEQYLGELIEREQPMLDDAVHQKSMRIQECRAHELARERRTKLLAFRREFLGD